MKINIKYILAFLILLIVEIIIALFVHDSIVRPYIGDMLVVILMYTLIRGFVKKSIKFLPVYLFLFASLVELAQYFHIVEVLHLQDNKFVLTIIGSSFDIKDIVCYLIATAFLIIWNKIEKSNKVCISDWHGVFISSCFFFESNSSWIIISMSINSLNFLISSKSLEIFVVFGESFWLLNIFCFWKMIFE